jgi:hypothetical protein
MLVGVLKVLVLVVLEAAGALWVVRALLLHPKARLEHATVLPQQRVLGQVDLRAREGLRV